MDLPALTSDHVGTNPIVISERHAHHSHLTMWEPIPQPCKKGPTLTFDTCEETIQHTCSKKAQHLYLTHVRNQSNIHVQKGSALTFDTCEEPIQHACSKGHALTYDHVGTNPIVITEWPSVPD